MFDSIFNFILQYKYVFIFYSIVLVWLVLHWSKIDRQAGVIFLYRMKWGLKWMDKYAAKYREWVIMFGYVSAGVGFVGMIFIGYMIIKNLYDAFFVAGATSSVSLVLPGVNIPGLGILPFWHWVVAIFVIAVIHEFSHGVVARAWNVKVKNTGIVLLGPIIGAFVEPDEKRMAKEKDIVQYSILGAGPFSNVVLAVLALMLLSLAGNPLQDAMTDPAGFTFEAYFAENLALEKAGIEPGSRITSINGVETLEFVPFGEEIGRHRAGDEVVLGVDGKDVSIVLGENPEDAAKPFLGITQIKNEIDVKEAYANGIGSVAYHIVDTTNIFLRWLFLLSLGIGLFNLLPLPIVDGGRMLQVFLWKLKGEKKGNKIYGKVSFFFLLVLILGLVAPWLMKLL